MAKTSRTNESIELRSLSRSISIYEPREPASGEMIILATWLGGTAKHIGKYTSLYRTVAPNAKILLIKAPMDSFLAPYSIQRRNIRPAIDPIVQILKQCEHTLAGNHSDTPTQSPHILLHIFSNGGANNILQLLHVWKAEIGQPLPLSGLIIDSALAIGGPAQNYRGFQQSIPDGAMFKLLGPTAATYALLVLETSIALRRYPRPETAMRRCIFDEALIQVGTPGKPSHGDGANRGSLEAGMELRRICYFASKADQNTPFQDIVSHAEEAREKGWEVDLHLWDDTPHCNHLGKHEEEYVRAVRSMWMLEKPVGKMTVRSRL